MLKVSLQTNLHSQIAKVINDFDRKQAAMLQEVGTKVLSLQQVDFERKSRRGQGDDGVVWAPLAESTERRKFLKGVKKPRRRKDGTRAKKSMPAGTVPRSQIGVDTGIMRNSVTPGYKAPDGDGGNILEVSGNSVTVGYGREYAPWFDQGNGRAPARPLMPEKMPQKWQESVEKVVDDWVQDIVSELGK